MLPASAVGSLHELGRSVNGLQCKARHARGAEDARALLTAWLKDIGYERHLCPGSYCRTHPFRRFGFGLPYRVVINVAAFGGQINGLV